MGSAAAARRKNGGARLAKVAEVPVIVPVALACLMAWGMTTKRAKRMTSETATTTPATPI